MSKSTDYMMEIINQKLKAELEAYLIGGVRHRLSRAEEEQ
jgi:hypothetical protein